MKSLLSITIIVYCLLFIVYSTSAYVMGSQNYRIQNDSINIGGASQSSTNYRMEDTIGEIATDESTSTHYKLVAGFMAKFPPYLSFTVSTNSLNLGTLSFGEVTIESHTITTATNAESGYTTNIKDDGKLRDGSNDIDDVADGVITAGDEEYGVATSDSGVDIVTDFGDNASALSQSGQSIASNSEPVFDGETTTVYYKVSISANNTKAGSYSHIVTFTCTANF